MADDTPSGRVPTWLGPLLPDDPEETPLAGSAAFALVYAAYATVVVGALLVASVPERGGVATVAMLVVVAATAVVVGLLPRLLRCVTDSDLGETLGQYGLGTVAVGVFLLLYRVAVVATGARVVLWSPGLVLTGLLGLALGVFSQPLLPGGHGAMARPGSYLEHHLTSWWRFVQLAGTAFFAFGIGIAATQLTRSSEQAAFAGEYLPQLTLVAAVGIVGFALYAAVKFHVVGSELREVYEEGDC